MEILTPHVRLTKKGKNYLGLCPFHKERTPSFNVSREKGFYKCFGCGRSGDVIAFVQEYLHLDFVEAVRHIAARMNVVIPEDDGERYSEESERRTAAVKVLAEAVAFYQMVLSSSDGAPARAFFNRRGFTGETIEQFALGASPASWDGLLRHATARGFTVEHLSDAGLVVTKDDGSVYDRFRGRAMFPIRDHQGRTVGFSARTLTNDPDSPKYINSPQSIVFDKSKVLYGLDIARRAIADQKHAIVVEGQADVIAMHQAGFGNTVAASGTSLTADHVSLIRKYAHQITLVFDADRAGQKAMSRAIELGLSGGIGVQCVVLPTGEDPDSLIRQHGVGAMHRALAGAMPWMVYQKERFEAEGQLADPLTKSQAIRQILSWIRTVPDSIQRPLLIQQLSEQFGIAEQYLHQELGLIPTPKNPTEPEPPAPLSEQKRPTILPAERTLLTVALTMENGLTDMVHVYECTPDLFITATARTLFECILVAAEEYHHFSEFLAEQTTLPLGVVSLANEIIASATDPSLRWRSFDVDIPERDNHRLIRDAVSRLHVHRVEMEIQHVKETLHGNHAMDEHRHLLHRLDELVHERFALLRTIQNPTIPPPWLDADSVSAS